MEIPGAERFLFFITMCSYLWLPSERAGCSPECIHK